MQKVVVYFKDYCPFCHRAMALLKEQNVKFEKIDLEEEPQRRDEMIQKANGRTTVPQIFIGDVHVGGCDDLFAMHANGKLSKLLGA